MRFRVTVLSAALGLFGLAGSAALPAASAAPAAPVNHTARFLRQPNATWPGLTSSNWSGYGGRIGTGKLTYASATWKVPKVTSKATGYSSTWVGIDGFSNGDLIQTGTEQDFSGGHFTYRAWWEILPAAETIIPSLTISPRDTITADVMNTSGNAWVISISDQTTGHSFTINKTYTGPGTSAEWIQEAPSNGSGVLPMAHYKETEFSNLKVATAFGSPVNPNIVFPSEAIAMVQNHKQVSTPSKPTGGDSFNVAYGKKQPAAP